MFKKAVLMVLMTMLIVFGASASYAYISGGMHSGIGVTPYINPDGLGDALVYGYYNVRGNLNLFNIVNTSTADGVKVRVIFREGKTSKEILDFSVCLSKGDVWTAYLTDDGTAGHIYGGVDTDTITAPAITSSGQQFKYGGTLVHPDGTAITADDTREGYFEVLGLSMIPSYDKNASSTAACSISALGGAATNCIRSESDCANWGNTSSGIALVTLAPSNVLTGNNSIFEISTLGTHSYTPTPFADAIQSAILDPGPGSELSIPSNMTSYGAITGCNLFDWLLAKDKIISPYDIMSSLGGETELILTFPSRLKCHGYNTATAVYAGTTLDSYFDCTGHADTTDVTKCTKYCTKIGIDIWNDKEQKQSILDFSPAVGLCLPYEVNVMKLGGSSIWNSTVSSALSMGTYQLGWIQIDLGTGPSSTHSMTFAGPVDAISRTATGVSVISYTTQDFLGSLASYMLPTMGRTNITP